MESKSSLNNKLTTMASQESLLAKYVRIILVVAAYWVVSIITVFVNKKLLSQVVLDAPLFITWFQCLTSVLICYMMKLFSKYFPSIFHFPESDPFNTDTIRKVLPLSIMFTAMIALNNLCLKNVSVSFYYIGRSLTTIFNVVFTFIILGEKTSSQCIGCCVLIIMGFFVGVDQEKYIVTSFSLIGVFYGVTGSLSLSLFSIYTKRVLPKVNNEIWLLSYYNNIYSCFLFVPLISVKGEIENIFFYKHISSPAFWILMCIGGLCGFAIGFLTSLQIKVTSPLTHNISGTAKACAQTVMATHIFNESRSFLWWLSNFIVLFGSAGYARFKQLDMEKKYNSRVINMNEKC